MNIELNALEQATERLASILHHTELDLSSTFSKMTGGKIYLKCENRQKTGSFKIRGASNKIAAMVEQGEVRAVVASSAGNHAQGVACAASKFGIPATIVMPKAAPIAKVQATEGYGAKVVLHGDCYDDAYAHAMKICQEEGASFLHPYNDPDVIAGQGTLGLEILSDLPYVDMIIVPAGGGGLLAGVAAAVKQINPRVQVYGVQAEGANAIAQSFAQKQHICTDSAATIAD
ncbi:MAG: pyridoxal-phosphate dependent enzyme, partial [Oscillospiraceae bacterium]|nr:pyridoxal-phosphate dependent enzyme [Oscillospiraceae bacterium]